MGVFMFFELYKWCQIVQCVTFYYYYQGSDCLQKNLKLKASEDNKASPSIYWISKLHKNSAKARFIIASPISSVKPLIILVTSLFKVMFEILQNFGSKFWYFSGADTIMIVWTLFFPIFPFSLPENIRKSNISYLLIRTHTHR